MLRTSTLALALSFSGLVKGFSGTHPIVAWSDQSLDSLSYLSSSIPSTASSNQQPLNPPSSDDLCSLESLLVISVPGLHYSDLQRLPLQSQISNAISSRDQHVVVEPYVRSHEVSKPLKWVRKFERECGATFESKHEKNLWSNGDEDKKKEKTIRVIEVDGLKEWGLTGSEADQARRVVLERVDSAVSSHLSHLSSPYAIILTSLPPAFSSPRPLKHKQPPTKRQLLEPALDEENMSAEEQEFVDEVLEEIKEEQSFEDMMDRIKSIEGEDQASTSGDDSDDKSDIGVTDVVTDSRPLIVETMDDEEAETEHASSYWTGEALDVSADYLQYQKNKTEKNNGTSIFEPKEGSGLLHRYVFFTPALVFSLLVSLLVLIPTVLIGVSALTSIETSYGLETKMTGSVGIDPSKQ